LSLHLFETCVYADSVRTSEYPACKPGNPVQTRIPPVLAWRGRKRTGPPAPLFLGCPHLLYFRYIRENPTWYRFWAGGRVPYNRSIFPCSLSEKNSNSFHMPIHVDGVSGLPLIHKGDDLTALICDRTAFDDGDILCIASSVYSKAKGFTRRLSDITPSPRAVSIAERTREDPRFIQAVLDASCDVLLEYPFVLSEVSCGHIGVRAGVDQSNIEDNMLILLPPYPMVAAAEAREEIRELTKRSIGVIITDTCGRSFRRGQTGHAIGWSGMTAIRDFRGDTDLFGRVLKITEEAVVDEIAGFANFVMGESNNGVPAVVFRNCGTWRGHDDLYFNKKEDFIRALLKRESV
jgi:coenzyme F420-0:L-glutamate ligase/coenzyme F420-1:gamma-L-glutamate ligase